MSHVHLPPGLFSVGDICRRLNEPLHRVKNILETRPVHPVARLCNYRLFNAEALAKIRHELAAIDARRAARAPHPRIAHRWSRDGGVMSWTNEKKPGPGGRRQPGASRHRRSRMGLRRKPGRMNPTAADIQSYGAADAVGSTDVIAFLSILHEPGNVFEVRAPDTPASPGSTFTTTHSGYFDDAARAAKAIAELDRLYPPGIYVTLNSCNPDLLSRAHNRIKVKVKTTTADDQILRRQWLPLRSRVPGSRSV